MIDKVNVRHHSNMCAALVAWKGNRKSERHGRAKILLAHARKRLRFNNIRFPAASAVSVSDGHAGLRVDGTLRCPSTINDDRGRMHAAGVRGEGRHYYYYFYYYYFFVFVFFCFAPASTKPAG